MRGITEAVRGESVKKQEVKESLSKLVQEKDALIRELQEEVERGKEKVSRLEQCNFEIETKLHKQMEEELERMVALKLEGGGG